MMQKLVLGILLAALAASNAQAAADAARGKSIYEAKCAACHSPEANRIGPAHNGVVGRKAGAYAGFAYSPALKKSGLVWTEANLDRWLQGPVKLVPGTRMSLALSYAQDRADVIAYLKTLTPGK